MKLITRPNDQKHLYKLNESIPTFPWENYPDHIIALRPAHFTLSMAEAFKGRSSYCNGFYAFRDMSDAKAFYETYRNEITAGLRRDGSEVH